MPSLIARASVALTLLFMGLGCGGAEGEPVVSVGSGRDAGDVDPMEMGEDEPDPGCDMVTVSEQFVVEHEAHFTARYSIGEPYTKTVMLFGGESVEAEDTLSNAYIMGLDKVDALALAEQFPDFYLCSSPGGDAAAALIKAYDLVPASCEVYEELAVALRRFRINREAGGDRTSLRFDGAPLELESVVDDASGVDVSDQVMMDRHFHLITSVEQLTGESVLSFGTTE